MSPRTVAVLLALLAPACGSPPAPHAPPLAAAEDARIGSYVSTRWTFETSSYWIEGKEGVILIDTQFLPANALAAAERAERATGKKVVAAFVLHANPDKFNGTAALQARGIKVLTSQQVAALIPAVHEKRLAAFGARYAPDYPTEPARPEVFGDKTTELTLAGLGLRAHVLGAGCSEAHIAIEFDGQLFVGDLASNGGHAWLEIGRTDEWLKRIAELRALSPKRVHPGRGASGGPELLDQQEAYLRAVIEIVAAEHPKTADDEEGIERAKQKIIARFPEHDWKVFLEMGVPAEWNRQVGAH